MSIISNGKVVSLAYTLTNTDGDQLDQSTPSDPFIFMVGGGQVIPGLETALEGLKKGDKKKATIPPTEARIIGGMVHPPILSDREFDCWASSIVRRRISTIPPTWIRGH